MVEKARSDLEAEVEKLEKQMKWLEILPSDVEQLAKVHIYVSCSCVCTCVCVCVCVCVFVCDPFLGKVSCDAWLIPTLECSL